MEGLKRNFKQRKSVQCTNRFTDAGIWRLEIDLDRVYWEG